MEENKETNPKQQESKEEKEIRIQNSKNQSKYDMREKNKNQQENNQNKKNDRHQANTWTVGEQQYKDQIREDLGNNKNGKPKMPVIFFKWTEKHENVANQVLNKDTEVLDEKQYEIYENTANKQWDKFYKNHKLGFFHHRYYLRREFPELVSVANEKNKEKSFILTELGCGVGDTIFPLKIEYPNLNLQACDFSSKAIEWVKKSTEYDTSRVKAEVMDLVNHEFPKEFLPSDLVTLIFCFSAISPENHQNVINKIYEWMKPGAIIYFRDYGKFDFAQLNFSRKQGRKLKEDFYVKHDGTRVYYAEEKYISELFKTAGFEEIECKAHYRYLENRKTGLEMYRVWIQGRFKKPGDDIFEYYGPIEFEEQILEVKESNDQQENNENTKGSDSNIGHHHEKNINKLEQKIEQKLQEKLIQNDKLLEEQLYKEENEQINCEQNNQQNEKSEVNQDQSQQQ